MRVLRRKDIVEIIKRRIANGEYAMRGIPSERELAEDVGVARMTARKALQILVDEGILIRTPEGGRLELAPDAKATKHCVGLLVPTLTSPDMANWESELRRAASKLDIMVRVIYYASWDDLALRDAMDNLDGLFLIPRADLPPPWLARKFRRHPCPMVCLGMDLTELELPSLVVFQPVFIRQLLDHLLELGHTHIDCVNTQGNNPVTIQRMEQWQFWRELHGFKGDLINEKLKNLSPARSARKLIHEKIERGALQATAIFCTTLPAARGTIRALVDHGLTPGKDVSVCTVDGEHQADLATPSITCLERGDTVAYLQSLLRWMISGQDWQGSLLMEISNIKLIPGESTGPAPSPASTT
ncbi:MAG: GntR family transcriptional regulator [Lentisphaerae bacterium]|nr:MAG: GntR family transcriptional regulator [Lentisphaerota bacterium]